MIINAMIKKEFKEMIRNYKLVIIPIVFMFLGALQPITYYYLPEILKMANMPEGAVLQIPTPSSYETIFSIYGQYTQLGLFILVLISMGAIANEVKSGVTENILVKPVPIKYYILSKWVAYFSLTILSTFLGVLVGKFYTTQLIGQSDLSIVIKSLAVYLIYLLFFVGLNLLLSSFLSSGILAGGLTIGSAIGLSLLTTLPFDLWWLPGSLLQINQAILYQVTPENMWLSIISTTIYIIVMFYSSVAIFKRKQYING